MIIPIYKPNGKVDEWLMIELQGDILSKTNSPLEGKLLGDLHFSKKGDPIFLIGHHVLHGKVVALEKPMLVTRKNTTGSSVSYDIVSVVRRKLLFKTRPKPIISCTSNKV
ncbi:Chromosome transmission fidelity protein 8 like [Schistosoma japonicum]|nr:Chromosome transmission fidelity protein 8 like [Schistosoma japonicum]KAH8862421.1 Chromosome transmission fidelity protein 8 like [Schistosoma japonicum]